MPQSPLAFTAVNPSGATQPGRLDKVNNLMVSAGGVSSALHLTAAGVIKATAGRLCKIVIVAGGTTSGSFTFNDCTTTGAATVNNTILSIPFGGTAGTVYTVDWPCANGIVLSAVPGAGSPIVSVSFS